ncbi:MAG: caspase family protein [Actinomycetota bacterium]|nr:caspase family protein [Actinomycetota bacterium]
MARGISLHIGLNKVDPTHYDGWDGSLNACELDANDLRQIADDRGFESSILLTAEATADAVVGAIERAARELAPGDLFLLTYSGHGGQVPDRNDEGEEDRSDETWLAHDRQIVDDELYASWAKFQAGVRILVLSDSCHSGTVTRRIEADVPDQVSTREAAAAQSPRFRALPRDVMIATYRAHADLYDGIQEGVPTAERADVDATVLLISGCRDDQLSLDGFSNGLFTENLLAVWENGTWAGGGHPQFHEAIRSRMPDRQQPNYTQVGSPNPDFEQQTPFTIG